MDGYTSTVYVRLDGDKIVDINSSDFLTDTDGWTAIDHGVGDRYKHAYHHYLPGRPCDNEGVSRWRLVDGLAVARTDEEIAADRATLPAPVTDTEVLNALLGVSEDE